MSDKSAVEILYDKLSEAADLYAMLRQEPRFSTKELEELVNLAARARDNANWLRAQRDTAESRVPPKGENTDV